MTTRRRRRDSPERSMKKRNRLSNHMFQPGHPRMRYNGFQDHGGSWPGPLSGRGLANAPKVVQPLRVIGTERLFFLRFSTTRQPDKRDRVGICRVSALCLRNESQRLDLLKHASNLIRRRGHRGSKRVKPGVLAQAAAMQRLASFRGRG